MEKLERIEKVKYAASLYNWCDKGDALSNLRSIIDGANEEDLIKFYRMAFDNVTQIVKIERMLRWAFNDLGLLGGYKAIPSRLRMMYKSMMESEIATNPERWVEEYTHIWGINDACRLLTRHLYENRTEKSRKIILDFLLRNFGEKPLSNKVLMKGNVKRVFSAYVFTAPLTLEEMDLLVDDRSYISVYPQEAHITNCTYRLPYHAKRIVEAVKRGLPFKASGFSSEKVLAKHLDTYIEVFDTILDDKHRDIVHGTSRKRFAYDMEKILETIATHTKVSLDDWCVKLYALEPTVGKTFARRNKKECHTIYSLVTL